MQKLKANATKLFGWLKTTAKTDKWAFFIFCITWIILESPCIVGGTLYLITHHYKWLALFLSWFALTAAPLPIPVVPISIAAGLAGNKIIKVIKAKRNKGE